MTLDTWRTQRCIEHVRAHTRLPKRIHLVTLLCCALLLVASSLQSLAARAPAAGGRIDSTAGDLAVRSISRLSGEWEFYWGRLYVPEDFSGADIPTPNGYLRVPGAWNDFLGQGRPIPGYGFATYRIVIPLKSSPIEPLALYIPYQQTAYRLWIDGVLKAENGVVSTSPENFVPEYRSVLPRFEPRSDQVEIVVQVANFAHRVGGMWNSPVVGPVSQMERWLFVRLATKVLLVGGFLIIALYHLFLYALRRETPKPALLGLFSLCVATRTLLMGDHILEAVLPLAWEWQVRIEYCAGFVEIAVMALLLRATFPAESPTAMVCAATLFGVGLGSAALLIPVSLSSNLLPTLLIAIALFMLYFIYVGILALIRGRPGGAIFFAGGMALAITASVDLLYYNRIVGTVNLTPFGYLALLISQAAIQAQEFTQALRNEAALVRELKESRRLLAGTDERERREVSEFLHSHVQTRLSLIMHKVESMLGALANDAAQAREGLEEICQEIDDIRENDIRQVSHSLHPTVIDVGLVSALRSLASQYSDAFQLSVQADPQVVKLDRLDFISDQEAEESIPHLLRLCAYRVVEECLSNIRKHASAERVSIDIRLRDANELVLTVSDNGKGFDPSAERSGLGLQVIQARAYEAGGRFAINTRSGAGTTITVTLPLKRH